MTEHSGVRTGTVDTRRRATIRHEAVGNRGAIVVENEHLHIEVDGTDGTIRSMVNLDANLEMVNPEWRSRVPFRIQLAKIDPRVFDRRGTFRGQVTGKTEMFLHFLKDTIGGSWSDQFGDFEASLDSEFHEGTAVTLQWTRSDGITVEARIELRDGATDAEFTSRIINGTDASVLAIEYPIIDGIRPLGESSTDNRLAHSVDGGFQFDDPHTLFKDPEILEGWRARRIIATTDPSGHPDEGNGHGGLFRVRGYPSGFEGAPTQFWTFYKENIGGFYFATHDPHATEKMFHFYSTDGTDGLTTSVVHYAWDWTTGSDLEISYPTLVGVTTDGAWFEAADRYRDWATGSGNGHPDWVRRGTLKQRIDGGDASRWLVEEVGFNTFGLPATFDISKWFDAFHEITGGPVLHIVGHDWEGGAIHIAPQRWRALADLLAPHNTTPSLQELGAVLGVPATEENIDELRDVLVRFRMNLWDSFNVKPLRLPVVWDEQNREAFKRNGDYLVPFLWRDFIGYGHDTEAYGCHVPITPFTTAFMCPTTDYWRQWHADVDTELAREGVDGIYYDVSASCATPTICMNDKHDHPTGFGRYMIDAYADVLATSRATAQKSATHGAYLPIGTEVIIENLIGEIDFAQCRAGAGVQATMEGEEFVEWQKTGRARKIPMFSYVYHEYGPVMLDGWAKLSPEFGDIFYEIGARVSLEGGLLQLNYEFSPLELFPGMSGSSYQLVYTNQIYEELDPPVVDPAKIAFIRELAAARTDFATKYLAYGRMIPSGRILSDIPDIALDWSHFNSVHRLRLEDGTLRTGSIVQVAWTCDSGQTGHLFVNLLSATNQEIAFVPSIVAYSDAVAVGTRGSTQLGSFAPGEAVTVSLPPRAVILVEFTPVPLK